MTTGGGSPKNDATELELAPAQAQGPTAPVSPPTVAPKPAKPGWWRRLRERFAKPKATTREREIPLAPQTPPAKPKLVTQGPDEPWPMIVEAPASRWLAIVVLVVICALYAWALAPYWAGAHSGVDQAGYLNMARLLTGEKNVEFPGATPLSPPIVKEGPTTAPSAAPSLAWMGPFKGVGVWVREHTGFVPEHPLQFGSRMSIMTEPFRDPNPGEEPYRIYAKYPFGFPLMAALARMAYGSWDGMYLVNPICTVLACFFGYFLFRTAVTRFAAIIGAIMLATNPVVLTYCNDANSHASTLFCVVFGFWGLLSWWQTGKLWRGFLGAFALGYACTIRYSEFLLVLPVTFAALANFRFTWKRARGSAAVLLGWAIPVATLALVCWIDFGAPWKTGYTYCKEDTGFGWKYFIGENLEPTNPLKQGNWETLIQQLNHVGLFMLWPLALAGLMGMLGKSWRLGTTLLLWVIPAMGLYTFYYWAPQGEASMGYLRFFASVVPGLIFAALWVVDRAMAHIPGHKWASLTWITLVGLGAGAWAVYYLWPDEPESWLAMWGPPAAAGTVAALLVGLIWIFERHKAAERVGLALALGALGALSCGVNLYTFGPSMERQHHAFAGLHYTVESLRAYLPAGSMLFADENLCQQLDSTGGYQLFSQSLLQPMAFNRERMSLNRKGGAPLGEPADPENPQPYQRERAHYYMELLGIRNKNGELAANPGVATTMMWELIDKALARGQRAGWVTYFPGRSWGAVSGSPPQRAGYVTRELLVGPNRVAGIKWHLMNTQDPKQVYEWTALEVWYPQPLIDPKVSLGGWGQRFSKAPKIPPPDMRQPRDPNRPRYTLFEIRKLSPAEADTQNAGAVRDLITRPADAPTRPRKGSRPRPNLVPAPANPEVVPPKPLPPKPQPAPPTQPAATMPRDQRKPGEFFGLDPDKRGP